MAYKAGGDQRAKQKLKEKRLASQHVSSSLLPLHPKEDYAKDPVNVAMGDKFQKIGYDNIKGLIINGLAKSNFDPITSTLACLSDDQNETSGVYKLAWNLIRLLFFKAYRRAIDNGETNKDASNLIFVLNEDEVDQFNKLCLTLLKAKNEITKARSASQVAKQALKASPILDITYTKEELEALTKEAQKESAND